MELHPANDKLREAEFFFMLMEKHFDRYEFRYFLSAFLSALYSCIEHNRLHSADARFKDWFQEMSKTHMTNLQNLREIRRHEIHLKGKETVQRVGFDFLPADGIKTTSLDVVFDFSSGKPVGRYKTAEMEEFKEYPVKQSWVWKTENEPDVMELCSKGLQVVREIIQSRDSMGFPD